MGREVGRGEEEKTYDGKVAADGARGGGERVGCAEDSCVSFDQHSSSWGSISAALGESKRTTASLHGVTAFPDHSADGATQHI